MYDVLGYEGQRAVVTGAASGMGEATVALLGQLGAEVVALDVRPIGIEVRRHPPSARAPPPLMPDSSAVAWVASAAGIGWQGQLATIAQLLDTEGFAVGKDRCEEHPEAIGANGLRFAYVTGESFDVDGWFFGALQTGQIDFSQLMPADG